MARSTTHQICIGIIVLLLVAFFYVPNSLFAESPVPGEYLERAREVLGEVPLIDGHNDVPWQYRARVNYNLDKLDFASDLSTLDPPMHTDINRLRKGLVGAQFWSVYVPVSYEGALSIQATKEQIDLVYRLNERYPDTFKLALTADDIERIFADGKISSLIGMEGGHSIENSLAVLRATYELGARYMTITHWRSLEWADAATDAPIAGGLTPFGEEVVREMNRLGMMVDLSHVAPSTMHAAFDVTEAPVIFSHSSAYEVCRHVRNVPDDVLKRVRENRGIVMVCFLGSFVSEELRLWEEARSAERRRLMREHRDDRELVERDMRSWRERNPRPDATLEQVADHIDHIRDVIGVEYIGIGGDYDGTTSLPVGLGDVSTYPKLFVELLRRGYSDEDVARIAGLNMLRVMREVENVAARLQRTRRPSEATIEELDAEVRSGPDADNEGN